MNLCLLLPSSLIDQSGRFDAFLESVDNMSVATGMLVVLPPQEPVNQEAAQVFLAMCLKGEFSLFVCFAPCNPHSRREASDSDVSSLSGISSLSV